MISTPVGSEAYIYHILAIDLSLADGNPFNEPYALEEINMKTVYRHQWNVHKIKQKTCEVYDSLMALIPARRGLRAGKIAALINKRQQTIAQYRTDVASTGSRAISADDLLKMVLARDYHLAHRYFPGKNLRDVILTGPTEALPEEKFSRFCAANRIFEVRDADGELVTALTQTAHAQQIADLRFGKVVELLHTDRPLPLSKEVLARSRFRKLMLSGRVTIDEACAAFERCPYSLLAYWTEHLDKEVPDERILSWLEAKAFESEAA